jgi:hypothetical protein
MDGFAGIFKAENIEKRRKALLAISPAARIHN